MDYAKALQVLAEEGVEFILVGGAAATAHGSVRLTQDLDIVYGRSQENLERLAKCLAPDLGDLDLLGEVVGGGNYENLVGHSLWLELFGIRCRCLDLDTLIKTKRAAGRPKDFDAIAELEAIARMRPRVE